MHILRTDVQMTRRRFFHFIFDEHENLLWSGQRVDDALNWLHDKGVTKFILDGDATTFKIAFAIDEG